MNLLRSTDTPSFTLLAFIPPPAQAAYLAIRAFNIEIARIADTASTPTVAAMRMTFWKDSIRKALEGKPPKQPVSVLLAHAAESLHRRTDGQGRLSLNWFLRIISEREKYINNNPYPTMESLERYAENTYSTLLYLTLQALSLNSITVDHVASHIGKASGIVTVLRGLPLIAFPAPTNHHSNDAGLNPDAAAQRQRSRQGAVLLPLDIMAEAGVREEDVLRRGAEAEGLRDAVFQVATRASDHLITARTMIQNLKKGQDVGHEFEHASDEEHVQNRHAAGSVAEQIDDIDYGFGALIPAVSTQLWLDKLQSHDFDIFRDDLRRRDWKLPWKAWLANRQKQL